MGAMTEDDVGGAFGVLNNSIFCLMECTHHLAGGVKRRFANTGRFTFHLILFQLQPRRIADQCSFGRLTHYRSVCFQLGVRAQRHCSGEHLFITVMLDDCHPILGEGAGFVAANNLRTAQRFNRRQPPDDSTLFAHFGDADGKDDGHDSGQPFRDGGNSQ